MKTSCSSWSYHRTFKDGRLDQTGWVRACAGLGLDGVELLQNHFPSTDQPYLLELRRQCADQFLTVAMLSAGGRLTTEDDARRAADVEELRRWADAAVVLGAPRVRFFCGSGKELAAGGDALYRKVVSAMKKVAEIGRERGLQMCLENHGGTTAEQVLSLLEDVDSPCLKLCLDTGNFPPTSEVGPETYDHIERCAPHAGIVHAKFFNVRDDGTDADFDWDRIHAILERADFRGFLSIEYEGADADETAVVQRIAKFLRTLR